MSTAARHLTIAASVILALTTGCTGMLEPDPTGGSNPDPTGTPDPNPNPNPDPDPNPTPTALTPAQVQSAFNGAVQAALSATPTGVTVDRTRDQVRIDGTVPSGAATVEFQALALTRAPFTVTGAATVRSGDTVASVAFTGTTSGVVRADGQTVGTITADFPTDGGFAQDTSIDLLGLAIDCQGLGIDALDGVVSLSGSCTVSDDNGAPLGSIDINGVDLDLIALTASGTITLTAGGSTLELVLDGTTAELSVDGQPVADLDLGDLLAGLL